MSGAAGGRLMGKTLTAVLGAVAVWALVSCSAYDAITIVGSKSPEQAAKAIIRAKEAAYVRNPTLLAHDVKRARRQFKQLVAFFSGEVSREWGSKEVLLPGPKRYVKYTQNYESRAVVNFDTGLITVETLDNDDVSLRNAIVTTLLTPDDPRAVDLYSDKTIKLSGTPYLYALVLDHERRAIRSPKRAEAYARHLVANERRERKIDTAHGPRVARYVQFNMVNDRGNKQAARYQRHVVRYARKYQVSKSLIFAVIKIESNFNPFAVSAAPAYGLMQLVPASGGREAYRAVKGVDKIPGRDYLLDAANNIELGTAYLGIIDQRYLGAIEDPTSREYCTIAAYNGGAGTVLRVFSSDRQRALAIINSLRPPAVYEQLRTRLPRQETRRYLVKVLDARRAFVNI